MLSYCFLTIELQVKFFQNSRWHLERINLFDKPILFDSDFAGFE